jgi:hypothetical protein
LIIIGKPGGVYFFFDGAAIGRKNSFVFMPKRIDLSSYFDKEFRKKEKLEFGRLPGDPQDEKWSNAPDNNLYKSGKMGYSNNT